MKNDKQEVAIGDRQPGGQSQGDTQAQLTPTRAWPAGPVVTAAEVSRAWEFGTPRVLPSDTPHSCDHSFDALRPPRQLRLRASLLSKQWPRSWPRLLQSIRYAP
jgi:hypothetical protein